MTRARTCSLGEFFRIKHGFAFKGEFFSNSGEYVLLTPGNFSADGGLKLKGEKEKFYTGSFPSDFLLREGDLIIALTDLTQQAPLLGAPAFVPKGGRYLHNQRLGKVVELRQDELDKGYLYYLFQSADLRAQVRATATGATVRHTAPERLYAIKCQLPRLDQQVLVASILGNYDRLIHNNSRRIAFLEEIIRTIYRQLFVERCVPHPRERSSVVLGLGQSSSGWSVVELGQLADEFRDSVNPREINPATPYFGLEHLPRRSVALDTWGTAGEVHSAKLRARVGDILFGKIRPYFHKVGVCPVDAVCSSDAIVLRPKKIENFGLILACVSSDAFVAHAAQTSQGTKMPRASWRVLQQYQVAMPPAELNEVFNAQVFQSIELIHRLCLKNANLRMTRNLLLPRLLSGELDVSQLGLVPK